jgi:hypothetical protein
MQIIYSIKFYLNSQAVLDIHIDKIAKSGIDHEGCLQQRGML